MLEQISKLDQAIIRFTQKTYLQCFDYTGLYVGTIEATVAIISLATHVFSSKGADFATYMIIGVVVLLATIDYYLQDKKEYNFLNQCAMAFIDNPLRKIVIVVFSMFPLLFDLIFLLWHSGLVRDNLLDIVSHVSALVYFYINTVLFRDREPKEWFPKRKLAFNGA